MIYRATQLSPGDTQPINSRSSTERWPDDHWCRNFLKFRHPSLEAMDFKANLAPDFPVRNQVCQATFARRPPPLRSQGLSSTRNRRILDSPFPLSGLCPLTHHSLPARAVGGHGASKARERPGGLTCSWPLLDRSIFSCCFGGRVEDKAE